MLLANWSQPWAACNERWDGEQAAAVMPPTLGGGGTQDCQVIRCLMPWEACNERGCGARAREYAGGGVHCLYK